MAAVVLHKPSVPPRDCVDLHVLDVGQGLTVVMRTSAHAVVYDAGPAFRSGTDTAALVTIPFLDALGIAEIDLLVVSHADLDHAGGFASLISAKSTGEVIAGEALSGAPANVEPCVAGQRWILDALHLTVVHPGSDSAWHGNNASCVLLAAIGDQKVLLTGDIEAGVESFLVEHLPLANTVIVPHHGSNTSSSERFVNALRPQTAIVSTGYRNRWGFPKPGVVDRWRSVGSEVVNTAADGAVSQRICRGIPPAPLRRNRRDNRRFWSLPVNP